VTNPVTVAIIAIGFQQAIDVTRYFNSSVRWSVEVEAAMLSVQRLQ
jgi:ABC-type multidrug transport system fused ATPase/permease subunit